MNYCTVLFWAFLNNITTEYYLLYLWYKNGIRMAIVLKAGGSSLLAGWVEYIDTSTYDSELLVGAGSCVSPLPFVVLLSLTHCPLV